jgi:branched-chain amino acid aminotransferase
VRRGAPDVQDPRLNSHSKLNCILACIQADKMGADEALMLDPHGFVATCNSTHFFIVRKGRVWTSTGRYCLAGITRANVLDLCRDNGIEACEKDFSLTDVYGADEAFVTGTFAGLIPVLEIDGRAIGAEKGPVTARLQGLYRDLCEREAEA